MKLIGLLAVLGGSLGFGVSLARSFRQELQSLEELTKGLRILREELAARLCPMGALLNAAAQGTEGEAAAFFRRVAGDLSELNERSFAELWRGACRSCLPGLSAEDRESLERLGTSLGRCELADQLAACDRFLSHSESRAGALRAALPERRRLTLALCAAAGLFLCLLIL